MATGDRFKIVVVCTGNRFRSPLAEHMLRREAAGLPVDVESFGLLDLGGVGVLPELAQHAAEAGLDVSTHRSRALAGADIAAADLVLGFERQHVARAVVAAGAALERTFTLPEILGLLQGGPDSGTGDVVARGRQVVARAAAARTSDPRRSSLPEVADPLGQPPEVVADIAEHIRVMSADLARALFGRDTPSPPGTRET